MVKPMYSNTKRTDTFAFRTKVNKKILEKFKSCLAYKGYPANVILELFMEQYSLGKLALNEEDILNLENGNYEVGELSTTFSKETYLNFKDVCQSKNVYVKYVLAAFMNNYANGDYVLRYNKTGD